MSATAVSRVDAEAVEELTPVAVSAADLESTAPGHLRDLKRDLAESGAVPAVLTARCCFDEACSLATESEANRLRDLVRAAAFLGAAKLEVTVEDVADAEATETALSACAERARREGVVLEVEGPIDVDG